MMGFFEYHNEIINRFLIKTITVKDCSVLIYLVDERRLCVRDECSFVIDEIKKLLAGQISFLDLNECDQKIEEIRKLKDECQKEKENFLDSHDVEN